MTVASGIFTAVVTFAVVLPMYLMIWTLAWFMGGIQWEPIPFRPIAGIAAFIGFLFLFVPRKDWEDVAPGWWPRGDDDE